MSYKFWNVRNLVMPCLVLGLLLTADESFAQSVNAGDGRIAEAVLELRGRQLIIPVPGADPRKWKGSFYQKRGDRLHEAVDIMAPRNTPVLAVDDGVIERISWNSKGGNTVYQSDATGRFMYYYAHLERYADGLKTGTFVKRGELIGYVGTTGNAPPDAPHLHFSISLANQSKTIANAPSIDPYEVFCPAPFAPDFRMAALRQSARPAPFSNSAVRSAGASSLGLASTAPLPAPVPKDILPYDALAQQRGNREQAPGADSLTGARGAQTRKSDFSGIGTPARRHLTRWLILKSRKWLKVGLPVFNSSEVALQNPTSSSGDERSCPEPILFESV